uniref:Uncharacterized protein n=1 Tax=Phaeomonas parva TaxID=124430 RepID=A0A7S1TSQ1_9STRA
MTLPQLASAPPRVQMRTVRSSDAVAIMSCGRPVEGAHATSRIQSVWALSLSDSFVQPFSPQVQMLAVLSQPPVTRRFCPDEAGAQDTALTPRGESWKCVAAQLSSGRCSRMLTLPSADAQARSSPKSCGAKLMEFTLLSWKRCAWMVCHWPPGAYGGYGQGQG